MSSVISLNFLTAVYSLVNVARNRIGDYFLTFDVKFIDLNSAEIVYAKTFQFESQEVAKGSLINRPDKINPYNLYINCLRQLDKEFIKTIAPYKKDRIVGFVKHKSLPDITNATKLLSIGENDNAIRMFQEMIKGKDLNSKSISIAYYNLSKAYLFNDEYDLAIKVLKDALINFVSLLGWHGSDNKEIYHIDELIEHFSIKRIRSSGAVFDTKKLLWFNQEYIKNMDSEIQIFQNALEFSKMLEQEGVDAITIHPRSRLQQFTGMSKWEIISEIVSSVRIPITGSGDVKSLSSAKSMMKKTLCNSVMIGRGSIGNPWIFNQQYLNLNLLLHKDREPLPSK